MVDQRRLTEEELAYLNSWPKFFEIAYKMDESIIFTVDLLCRLYTYERICTTLMSIERIWRDYASWPDAVPNESAHLLSLVNKFEVNEEGRVIVLGLNSLCKTHGYGRMGQMASAMAEMYQAPVEGCAKWKAFHDERMSQLDADMRGISTNNTEPEQEIKWDLEL